MEKSRALELLRPIVQSAQAPVLREYQPKAAQALMDNRTHGRMPLMVARLAVASCDELARATWESMRRALDDTRLDWTEDTHQELQAAMEDVYTEAVNALHDPFDRMVARHADGVAAAKQSLADAANLHLRGAKAQLEIYVTARRRAEIVQVLAHLEERLLQQDQAEVLAFVREARQRAEAAHTNDGQLKESLAVLSQSLPAIVAANDLGQRLLEVARWI